MKVLLLIHHLRIGGAERIFVDLAAALKEKEKEKGVDVLACSLSPGGPLLAELQGRGVRHVQLRKGPLRFPLAFDLARLLAEEEVDVLHTHEFSASQWGRLAARLRPVPIVHTEHAVDGWIRPRKHKLVNAFLGRRYAKIACVSEAVRDSLSGSYPAGLLEIIPNGISLARLSVSRTRQELRAAHGIPAGRRVIGTVGRLSREKGTDIFLRSLAALKRVRADFLGMVIGDGAEKDALAALVRDLDLEAHVRLVGAVPDPQEHMALFDIAVFASRQESFGLALVEQAMFRTPTLAAAVGGIPALAGLLPGIHLVGREDPEGIAARLAAWLDHPPAVPDVSATIRDRFSIERTADAYLEAYRRCLAPRTTGGG
jgi:glycosyltransferase involved in cell wall biosynthesis